MKLLAIIKHPTWYLWPLPAVAAVLAQRLLAGRPDIVKQLHTGNLFRWISQPIAFVTSLVPFSLTEMLLLLGVPLLTAAFIIWLVRLFRKTGKKIRSDRKTRVGRLLRRTAWTVSILFMAYMLLHGLNYDRQPVAESFNLSVHERSAAELEITAAWLVQQANLLRAGCEEDNSGVFALNQGIDGTLRVAADAYDSAADQYPLLAGPTIRPKGVLFSRYWSYTFVTGMYFPFFVEANVNIDMPEYLIPGTALHEIAHSRGFAREDEAGFIAFLAGISLNSSDFAYSVVLDAALRCLNELYSSDQEAWTRLNSRLNEAVRRDIDANNVYWTRFAGPVQEASEQINDAFLQANLQEDGVKSYGRMLDLVLAWHEEHLAANDLDSAITVLAAGRD